MRPRNLPPPRPARCKPPSSSSPARTASRTCYDALARASGKPPLKVWHRDSELPEGRPDRHPRRLLLWRLPALRRDGGAFADHARGQGAGRAWHAGAGHLQRLPDPDRGGAAARRAAAQQTPQLPSASDVHLRVETSQSALHLPLRSGPGAARAGGASRRQLFRRRRRRSTGSRTKGQVAFRYSTPAGELTEETNPNGSARSIAGIFNESKTVLGLMPHPEDATDPLHGWHRRASACSPAWSRRCMSDALRRRRSRPRSSPSTASPPRNTRALFDILGRAPNLTELGIFSVMWSEHCSYKSSQASG